MIVENKIGPEHNLDRDFQTTHSLAEAEIDLSTFHLEEAQRAQESDSLTLIHKFQAERPLTRGTYEGSLQYVEDGIYISPEKVAGPELPRVLAMHFGASEFELGAGDSRHEVVFGSVVVEKTDGQAEIIRTAVKPFAADDANNADMAGHEHDALLSAEDLGFDTLEPLAVAKDGDIYFLVTRHRADIKTLDNENWTVSPSERERYRSEVLPNLHFIADSLAQMHSKGLFNGDAQPKNIARSDTGKLVVIDLESATIANDAQEHVTLFTGGGIVRESEAHRDIRMTWYRLTHPENETKGNNILFSDESYETCMEEFEMNFLNRYLEKLKQVTPPELYEQFNIDELRDDLYRYVAQRT